MYRKCCWNALIVSLTLVAIVLTSDGRWCLCLNLLEPCWTQRIVSGQKEFNLSSQRLRAIIGNGQFQLSALSQNKVFWLWLRFGFKAVFLDSSQIQVLMLFFASARSRGCAPFCFAGFDTEAKGHSWPSGDCQLQTSHTPPTPCPMVLLQRSHWARPVRRRWRVSQTHAVMLEDWYKSMFIPKLTEKFCFECSWPLLALWRFSGHVTYLGFA